jgi:hypothetical protein
MNTLQITPPEQRRLDKLHADFIAKLQSLPEKRRMALIKAAAHNVLGTTDPWTQAVARQMLDVHNVNESIRAAH